MRTVSVTIDAATVGRTVQSVLANELSLSGGLISRLKRRSNGITVNGQPAYTTHVLMEGDVLMAIVSDPPDARRALPLALPLDVLYEDKDILILNKPAGLTVHADSRKPGELTLDNALAAYLPQDEFPHPVSRLDRGTTGVITYAKSGYVHELLRRMLHTPDFPRTYLAVAAGVVDPPAGSIALPIGFAPGSTYRHAVTPDGASARTEYRTLSVKDGNTLLSLVPCTGRTHQLRVHMAAIGYPLVGDWLYGARDARIDRPALHAYTLHLVHSLTGAVIDLAAEVPADFLLCL